MKNIKNWGSYIIIFILGVLIGSMFHLRLHLKIIGEEFGSIADWLGTIGTLAAVVVSLYLANRGNKPMLYFYIQNQKDGGSFGVQNKSYNPVELEIKWGKQQFMLPLPPIGKEINDLIDDNPFNGDYINLGIHDYQNKNSKEPVKLKGYDRVSASHYKVYFYRKNNKWIVKQYKLFAIGLFCI